MTHVLSSNPKIASRQVPVVCRACQAVHRISPEMLSRPHVTCPGCGVARSTSAVIAALPPNFMRAPMRPRSAPFSEFPTRG